MGFIDKSAVIKASKVDEANLYRNVVVNDSVLDTGCSVGDDSTIVRCKFGKFVIINRRNYINDSEIGSFSYTGLNTIVRFTHIGKFCSIAPNVDIGGMDHDYTKVTTMPEFRFKQMLGSPVEVPDTETIGRIGNDVWIATGAIVLRKCNISDGAIVGAGAVVTHDVPPYAIVAGVLAKVIGYRFANEYITRLLAVKWWDLPEEILRENMMDLIHGKVDDSMMRKLEKIAEQNRFGD